MTHGEEPGSETHQDSAVLTYLEGLLMHQVAGGPGATGARRAEAGGRDGGPEPRPPPSRHAPDGRAPAAGPEQDRRPPAGGAAASQHLRKARLLRSEEGWAGGPEAGRLRALGAEPAPALNGRGRGEPLRGGGGGGGGALEGSPKCKGGESTLLASLLQSFSSRLQTVALSQQIMQNLKQPEPAPLGQGGERDRAAAAAAAEPRPCLGAASSRLKGFLKKSKTQSHGGVPYRRRPAPGRLAPSPQPPTGGGKGAGVGTAAAAASASASDSLSCAARLKAVASLVNTRASPAPSPSPRPSVACSQLALLLSSEAHLQQYSREQALKAQLSGRSASERLAAMATQQSQLDSGNPATRPSPDALASPNARNGAALSPSPGGGASSPRRTPQPPKERRGFDRSSARPSQNCSSLLLHLLNNHHAQKHANGHAHGHARPRDYREDRAARPARGSPLPSDGEYSSPENGLLPPRDGSDTESSRSSGSPIDLSVRSRAPGAPPGSSSSSSSFASSSFSSSSSSSLDRLTESLINRWRPENPPPPPPAPAAAAVAVKKEPETAAPVRPHHKVTLLQLLLDHRNGEGGRGQRSSDSPDARQGAALQPPHTAGGLGVAAGGLGVAPGAAAGRLTPVCRPEESSGRSPHGGPGGRGFQAPPSFARGVDSNGGASRYSPCPAPPAQSAPLNLCKSEAPSNPDGDAREPAFTASKLLQNLAQCGLQTPPKTPLPPPRLRADPPVTLLERLNTPILRNGTPLSGMPLAPVVSNGSHVSDAPRTSPANPPSEIQSLLERRTVLQLLLGATGGKERPPAGGGRRKRAACGGAPDQSNRRDSPPPDVRIKTEPEEDDRAAPEGEDGAKPPPPSWGGGAGETLRPLSAAARPADVKPEPGSPGAVPRDGLLSQLLRQRCRSLPVSAPTGAVMSVAAAVKEEPGEPLAPPTEPQAPPAESQAPPTEPQAPPIPKKRRVCIEGFPQERPVSAASGVGGARRSVSGSPERLATQNGGSLMEPDSPSRGPAGNSPPADARGGFNVLKQLLLSDNCLKDLSQLQPRRGSPSPSAPRPSDLHKLAASPWDHAPQGSGVADRARSASPPPWGVRDSPKANLVPVKREAEAEGTARWAAGVEERPDSPRLTQANPILYYMLQKSNSHLGRGGRGARGPLCSAGGAQGQPRVKEEEPAPLAEDDDHKLNAKRHPHQPEGPPEGAVERLNGSLEKC
ncbi:LOW QUALITY PROTEIN: nuclear receptor-interacting protein 1 [Anguilla rostrata]|uniref:LOW QUALITY PROTEIN: nuclear receptor-interacting protein 1 n=1 Tax=Anguilla rostrata TaxID=7938 RepID=UPI0030D0F554